MSHEESARSFAQRLGACDTAPLSELLAEDATLRLWTWESDGAHRPRHYALEALAEVMASWIPGSLELLAVSASADSAALQFRLQSRPDKLIVDQNAGAFLSFSAQAIQVIDLYLSLPVPAAERGRMLRGQQSPEERLALIESLTNRWDLREFFPSNTRFTRTRALSKYWTGIAHPSGNSVSRACWTEEEAEVRIEEVVAWFRGRGMGMKWTVGPFDEPKDLGERLLRHGFLRAGDQALMLRFGLSNLGDIPENSEIEVIDLQQRQDLWEASLQLTATAFHWPSEQTDNERDGFFEDLASDVTRSVMALLHGEPVADAHMYLQAGVAYLGGAATLPPFRGRKIYSTLLRRRLERAGDEGYEVAMIHAEPMSRRVVSRFAFETCAMFDVYGWMEPMDREVITKLVVDD